MEGTEATETSGECRPNGERWLIWMYQARRLGGDANSLGKVMAYPRRLSVTNQPPTVEETQ